MNIINRKINLRLDTCYKINLEKGNLGNITKEFLSFLISLFDRLRSNGKDISSIEDLKESMNNIRTNNLAKKRVLQKKENAGYVMLGGLTIFGIIGISVVIFMAVNMILGR